MKVALRLLNDRSDKFVKLLMDAEDVELIGFVDINADKWETNNAKYDIPYISPYKALQLYKEMELSKIIISPFINSDTVYHCIEEMHLMGIEKNDFSCPSIPDVMEATSIDSGWINQHGIDKFNSLYRVQLHIADHCNLNCDLCSHFSSLVRGEHFIQPDECARDLKQLHSFCKHIDYIDILGGEPFLNKSWKECIINAKEIFKYSQVTIITNGTRFETLSNDDWKFIRDNDVIIRVSLYPPFWKKAEEIELLLRNKKTSHIIEQRIISQFSPVLSSNVNNNTNINREICLRMQHRTECNQLWHGKMTPCSQMMYVRYLNEYFDADIPDEVSVDDIYKVKSFKELIDALDRVMPICNYCRIYNQIGAVNIDQRDWNVIKRNETKLEQWV